MFKLSEDGMYLTNATIKRSGLVINYWSLSPRVNCSNVEIQKVKGWRVRSRADFFAILLIQDSIRESRVCSMWPSTLRNFWTARPVRNVIRLLSMKAISTCRIVSIESRVCIENRSNYSWACEIRIGSIIWHCVHLQMVSWRLNTFEPKW